MPMKELSPRMKASMRPAEERVGETAESVKNVSCWQAWLSWKGRGVAWRRKNAVAAAARRRRAAVADQIFQYFGFGVGAGVAGWMLSVPELPWGMGERSPESPWASFCKSALISFADAYLWSGSFWRARVTMVSVRAGRPGQISGSGRKEFSVTACRMEMLLFPWKGGTPVRDS